MSVSIQKLIEDFTKEFKNWDDFIYNEFSLQHELGIYLRGKLPKEYLVQFEKNVKKFTDSETVKETRFEKKEIDIVIVNTKDENECYAIELKYPVNGEYPVQMFKFVEDIRFMEQVKSLPCFKDTFVFCLVEQDGFYVPKNKTEGIYQYFRGENPSCLKGTIENPVKNMEKKNFKLENEYSIKWEKVENGVNPALRYYFLEIK